MSKRARQTLVNLGNLPYTTNDGGKWLRKVLDPVDTDVDVIGMPDTETNARAILNYQFQSDVPIPRQNTYIPATVSSYDADLYLFQDPIILGAAFSYPQGTKNIAGSRVQIIHNTQNGHNEYVLTLDDGCAPRTPNIILNEQIEGSTVREKMASLKRYCQRFRIIYGGVQAIPACSALYDSGTIEASQQVFSPENTNISNRRVDTDVAYPVDGKVHRLQSYAENDFPDAGTSIQNPAALYCRYKEGMYMPYKLRNPLIHSYRGSEERTLCQCPYIVTDITFYGRIHREGQAAGAALIKMPTIYDPATLQYKANHIENYDMAGVMFECYTKLGHKFYINLDMSGNGVDLTRNYSIDIPTIAQAYNGPLAEQDGVNNDGNANGWSMRVVEYDFTLGAANVPNNSYEDVYSLPVTDTNIGVCCFKAIGLQAAVRLVFRLGVEMMITAGGVYSPFKHKAPKYDQRAINSYIRACHNMRDAFLGDAATSEGHAEFSSHIAEIVASGDNINVSNTGSSWYGRVRTV